MTVEEMIELFEKEVEGEDCLHFKDVENKKSTRKDLHAFLLLEEIAPGEVGDYGAPDIVAAAEHDVIWMGVDIEKLAQAITPEQIIELKRCGVLVDEYGEDVGRYE